VLGELAEPRDAAEIERLFRRHEGNVREALRDLYDACAVGADTVKPPEYEPSQNFRLFHAAIC
jgi:hypothetical protein